MRFWDSSAVVPLLVPEASSERMKRLHRDDPVVLAWWGPRSSACPPSSGASDRETSAPAAASDGLARLHALRRGWHEVEPGEEVHETAKRLLRVHDLRAADALQLAAAFFAAERRPSTLQFVCLDERLTEAAQREGFATTPLRGASA